MRKAIAFLLLFVSTTFAQYGNYWILQGTTLKPASAGWTLSTPFTSWTGTLAADSTAYNTTVLKNYLPIDTLLGATTYNFEGVLLTSIATSAGEKVEVLCDSTPTYFIYSVSAFAGTTVGQNQWSTSNSTALTDAMSNVSAVVYIKGTIVTNTACALYLRYAQNTQQTTANTVKQGSYLRVWKAN